MEDTQLFMNFMHLINLNFLTFLLWILAIKIFFNSEKWSNIPSNANNAAFIIAGRSLNGDTWYYGNGIHVHKFIVIIYNKHSESIAFRKYC